MDSRYGKENALVLYGGGLCDCAAYYISTFAKKLDERNIFNEVFVGYFSFRALTEEGLIKQWKELNGIVEKVFPGYFGTARETDLTDLVLQKRAIQTCKDNGIGWIFLAGGDGSARQMSEIAESFSKEGIQWIFTMPLTIDGINGGGSLGIQAAVEASLNQIEFVSSTALRTLQGNAFPGIVFELQGRNRDDILISVLDKIRCKNKFADFKLEEIDIISIPANYEWNEQELRKRLNLKVHPYGGRLCGKPVVILLSEGASITMEDVILLGKEEGRKIRSYAIGHFSQVNGFDTDKWLISDLVDEIIQIVCRKLDDKKPFSIVYDQDFSIPRVEKFDYFAERNPRSGYKQELSQDDIQLLAKYTPNV